MNIYPKNNDGWLVPVMGGNNAQVLTVTTTRNDNSTWSNWEQKKAEYAFYFSLCYELNGKNKGEGHRFAHPISIKMVSYSTTWIPNIPLDLTRSLFEGEKSHIHFKTCYLASALNTNPNPFPDQPRNYFRTCPRFRFNYFPPSKHQFHLQK